MQDEHCDCETTGVACQEGKDLTEEAIFCECHHFFHEQCQVTECDAFQSVMRKIAVLMVPSQ